MHTSGLLEGEGGGCAKRVSEVVGGRGWLEYFKCSKIKRHSIVLQEKKRPLTLADECKMPKSPIARLPKT